MILKGRANFSVSDIFGLANQLKETRKCKIIFVLNQDGLDVKEKRGLTCILRKLLMRRSISIRRRKKRSKSHFLKRMKSVNGYGSIAST